MQKEEIFTVLADGDKEIINMVQMYVLYFSIKVKVNLTGSL